MKAAKREQTPVNDSGTGPAVDAPLTRPRSLSDLRSFLHDYRIKHKALFHYALITRASIIIQHIDDEHTSPAMFRAARELANLDPTLSWLPAWKPRVTVAALSKGTEHETGSEDRRSHQGTPSRGHASERKMTMTDEQIKYMVDRFLMWKFPKTTNPDGGFSLNRIAGHDAVGTNLLSAVEADAMVRHMIEGMPS